MTEQRTNRSRPRGPRRLLYAASVVPPARAPIALMALGLALQLAGLVVMFAAAFDPHLSTHPFRWTLRAAAFFVPAPVASAAGGWLWKRLSRKAAEEGGGTCPRCLYSGVLGAEHKPPHGCPECGFVGSPEERRHIWERAGLL